MLQSDFDEIFTLYMKAQAARRLQNNANNLGKLTQKAWRTCLNEVSNIQSQIESIKEKISTKLSVTTTLPNNFPMKISTVWNMIIYKSIKRVN